MAAEKTATRTEDEVRRLEALRNGDEAAYAELVNEQFPILFAVTRRILRSDEEAQDAVQEAFLSAIKALPKFDGKAKVSTWLHRIAINAALMKLRKRPRSRERAIDDLLPRWEEDGHPVEPATDWDAVPEVAIESRETRDLVRTSIDELPEIYRTVLLLRDIEGLDTAETAELLEVTPNVVKVRLHRARQALRSLLDPHLRRGAV